MHLLSVGASAGVSVRREGQFHDGAGNVFPADVSDQLDANFGQGRWRERHGYWMFDGGAAAPRSDFACSGPVGGSQRCVVPDRTFAVREQTNTDPPRPLSFFAGESFRTGEVEGFSAPLRDAPAEVRFQR